MESKCTDEENLEYARIRVLDILYLANRAMPISEVMEILSKEVERQWTRLAVLQLCNEGEVRMGYNRLLTLPENEG